MTELIALVDEIITDIAVARNLLLNPGDVGRPGDTTGIAIRRNRDGSTNGRNTAGMTTTETPVLQLTDDDRFWLGRFRVGRQLLTDWLASGPPTDRVRSMLVKTMDRYGQHTVYSRVLTAHIGADLDQVYAQNWPRKAARLAAEARTRGDHPHADKLHAALVALMFCGNCSRPLNDPVSIGRGIDPDCWDHIDPGWRNAIIGRVGSGGRS